MPVSQPPAAAVISVGVAAALLVTIPDQLASFTGILM
jgi:hypothetical protein